MQTSNLILGKLINYHAFASQYITPRNVNVWLPPVYSEEANFQSYPVIYMHDGQNLFDPKSANMGIDWGIDEAISSMIDQGLIEGAIVVGIWSVDNRWREYMPQKALETEDSLLIRDNFAYENNGLPYSDLYLRFIVEELKPFIDQNYRTKPERENTYIMGSSMGGLISLYGLCEYPHVFRGAGCLSTHWPAGKMALIDYVKEHLPAPGKHKLYFDYGTQELDAEYEPYQEQIDLLLVSAGYKRDVDWITLKFPGAGHSESAWRARLQIPLEFLIG